MRLIGHLATESSARTFGDYLYVQGIGNHLEFEKESGWAVWITDEDKIAEASSMLGAFSEQPSDAKYRASSKAAAQRRAEEAEKLEAYRKRVVDASKATPPLAAYGFGPVNLVLMGVSLVVFVLTKFGEDVPAVSSLLISEYYNSGLTEIAHGQVWRLITPIFVHFGIWHILFNLLWLRDLGGQIEVRLGSWFLVLMVVGIAAVSNFAQYLISGPVFGGMSGVVYGLLGYLWMKSRFDPASGLFVHQTTVVMMIAWFFLCYTGLLGHVANTAHAAGLAMGMAWGYLSSLRS